MLKRCFPPAVNARTRVLVLGSLPGDESLARGQYYANPRNQFWRLIGAVIMTDLATLAYQEKLEALLRAGVGLWDTIGAATRQGSLDGNIRLRDANDLSELAATLPELRAVGFNGGKSASLGMKQLPGKPDLALLPLPSSSPAYTRSFDSKLVEWKTLQAWL